MFYEFLNYAGALRFTAEWPVFVYDSIPVEWCFKEVIIGNLCGKISTFDCRVSVHILKKVHFTEGQTSHCPKWPNSFETLLNQCLTFIKLDYFESTILLGWQSHGHVLCVPLSLPHREQQCLVGACWIGTLTSLWPAYEPMDYTGDIAWQLLFTQVCLQCKDFVALCHPWPPYRPSLLINIWRGLKIRLWWPVSYHLQLNPSSSLWSFSTFPWSYSLEFGWLCVALSQCNWLIQW